MEEKNHIERARGLNPLTENEYYDYVAVLLRRKSFASELDLAEAELLRMKKALKPFNIDERILSREEMDTMGELIDYRDFVRRRKQTLEIEAKAVTAYNTLYDSDGFENALRGNTLNAVQKIILLNELGVVTFLRETEGLSTSVNNLAGLISLLTGERQSTLQPYLNALITETAAENKHPYFSKSSVQKVRDVLTSKGIQPKKT